MPKKRSTYLPYVHTVMGQTNSIEVTDCIHRNKYWIERSRGIWPSTIQLIWEWRYFFMDCWNVYVHWIVQPQCIIYSVPFLGAEYRFWSFCSYVWNVSVNWINEQYSHLLKILGGKQNVAETFKSSDKCRNRVKIEKHHEVISYEYFAYDVSDELWQITAHSW